MNIAVLMSTYNGADYLEEQIISILNQRNVKVDVYIRDDGSTDSTPSVLENFKQHKNVFIEYGSNKGYTLSFLHLLAQCSDNYDYYAFADQDDVWVCDKLCRAVSVINKYECPVLYSALPIYVDKNLNAIKLKKSRIDSLPFGEISYRDIFVSGIAGLGCTMVLNKKLKVIANFKPDENLNLGHDNLLSILAAYSGVVYRDDFMGLMYRQHNINLSGDKAISVSISKRIRNKIENLLENKNFQIRYCIYSNFARFCKEKCRAQMLSESLDYKNSLSKRLSFLKTYFPNKLSNYERFKFIIKVLLGTF